MHAFMYLITDFLPLHVAHLSFLYSLLLSIRPCVPLYVEATHVQYSQSFVHTGMNPDAITYSYSYCIAPKQPKNYSYAL